MNTESGRAECRQCKKVLDKDRFWYNENDHTTCFSCSEKNLSLAYEHHICDYHRKEKDETVWHWVNIPEGELENAGFITDYNKLRLNRIEKKKNGENNIREYGLDGLSLDKDGNYHGLQAKYWKSTKLTAHHLGTFLSVMYSRFFVKNKQSKGYLYHTCLLQIDLIDDFKNNPNLINICLPFTPTPSSKIVKEDFDENIYTDETKLELYPPQKEALTQLKNNWKGIGLISMPCALGKTIILGNYLRDTHTQQHHIMILSPLRILTKQMLDRIKQFIPTYFELLIDSDEGDATTDEDYILEMMNKQKCLISITYDSFKNIFLKKDLNNTLIIVDEAHNLSSWDKINNKLEEIEKSLLLTATPSNTMMDISNIEIIYDYPMRKAIENKYITDYLINLPIISNDKIDIDIPTELNDLDKDLTMKSLFLISGMLERGSRKCIVYCGSIEECNAFNTIFKKVCEEYHGLSCWAERINADINKNKRSIILKNFQENENKLSILTSVRILNEGINIIKCDSVFITKVNDNEITAIQRMCRANRLDKTNPNKIANCFIWADDMNKSVNMLQYLKINDETQFFNKIKTIGGNYEKKHIQEVVQQNIDYKKTVRDIVNMKCMSFEQIQLERAKNIVSRGIERENKGGRKIPRKIKKPKNEEENHERKDAQKLGCWKQALKGKWGNVCCDKVKEYLDENLPGWNYEIDFNEVALQYAKEIVSRGIEREKKGGRRIPRSINKPKNPEEIQENKDARRLGNWKIALKGKDDRKCCPEVKEYLDKNLLGWNNYFNERELQHAKEIVSRGIEREKKGGRRIPREIKKPKNPEEIQETKDARKLRNWKIALKGKDDRKCCPEVKEYLDENLPGWNNYFNERALQDAKEIVSRGIEREKKGGKRIPRGIKKPKNPEEIQEKKDADKLQSWKQALKGIGRSVCCDKVKEYLDENLPGWRIQK